MSENDKNYEKLLLKRDICRFVFDLRCYEHIASGQSSKEFDLGKYKAHMTQFGNWYILLQDFFRRAERLEVNPNVLANSEYDTDDDLRLQVLDREINSILLFCRDAKTLCAELMRFYSFIKTTSTLTRNAVENAILDLTVKYGVYDEHSKETAFFLNSYTYDMPEDWFERAFIAHFFKEDISIEAHIKNLGIIIDKILNGNLWATNLFTSLIPRYASLGVVMDEADFIRLLECKNDSIRYSNIYGVIGNNPSIMPFTIEEYLDSLFGDLINGKNELQHYCNSVFNAQDGSRSVYRNAVFYEQADLKTLLKKLIIPLANASKKKAEFFKLYANKIALLPDSLDIAAEISDYLKTVTGNYAEVFDSSYLEAVERLKTEREAVVLVLNEVKKKKNERSAQEA